MHFCACINVYREGSTEPEKGFCPVPAPGTSVFPGFAYGSMGGHRHLHHWEVSLQSVIDLVDNVKRLDVVKVWRRPPCGLTNLGASCLSARGDIIKI